MIIVRSPLRISLGGGGTDLPSYYREHGGFCLSAAIDKYVYIAIHENFTDDLILHYSKHERVKSWQEIEHPIIRTVFWALSIKAEYLEISSMADIPAGTGLGSSSSFTTALLQAWFCYRHRLETPDRLAQMACWIEIDRMKQPIGKQDQYISAFGGLRAMHFGSEHEDYPGDYDYSGDCVTVDDLKIDPMTLANLEDRLMLFFTGYSRNASDILRVQDDASKAHDQKMTQDLHIIKDLAYNAKNSLESGNLRDFGALMHEHWVHKRHRSKGMTNEQIDNWYDLARYNGAVGGKLVGAGGGGFLLLYVEDRARIRKVMTEAGLQETRFRFDFEGTKVICQ